jgi:plastocyanin
MATVQIKRVGDTVVFDPSTVELGSNDFVMWANLDPEASHQPTPDKTQPSLWMDFPLPPFVDGEPAATSPALSITGTAGTSRVYFDGCDPDGPGGTISF